ncbi:hypothetical protein ABIC45_002342 [Mucilaginibacter rubeus]|uniref:hypothetical protein n=1 Tax=Mucilaginibacter rubeus TaxID=2027860 RepID=UPI0033975784
MRIEMIVCDNTNNGRLRVFIYQFYNMGVACGPGFPLQVLAFPAQAQSTLRAFRYKSSLFPRKPNPRSGLFTAIPNAAPAHRPLKYILNNITVFSGFPLRATCNDMFSV